MADIEKLVDQLSELSVLEAAELTKALEEKWGVSAAAPVAVAAAAGPAAGAEPAAPGLCGAPTGGAGRGVAAGVAARHRRDRPGRPTS